VWLLLSYHSIYVIAHIICNDNVLLVCQCLYLEENKITEWQTKVIEPKGNVLSFVILTTLTLQLFYTTIYPEWKSVGMHTKLRYFRGGNPEYEGLPCKKCALSCQETFVHKLHLTIIGVHPYVRYNEINYYKVTYYSKFAIARTCI
jgi:hypothetical protein